MLSRIRSLFPTTAPSPRSVRLGLDAFEDRVVPASVGLVAPGVVSVQADAATSDVVTVVAAGAATDGSTGVTVTLNGESTTFAGPITHIALDMKDGNDSVTVASLTAVSVAVGEGNGTNVIKIGATRSAGVIAGQGQNTVSIGGGTENVWTSEAFPGVTAGSAVFIGYEYAFSADKRTIATDGFAIGNHFANSIDLTAAPGQTVLVNIVGDGNNKIIGGNGNSAILIEGSGDNTVKTGTGTDYVTILGNGSNLVTARGSGKITITGAGENTVRAGRDPDMTVELNFAGPGSLAVASNVILNGVQVSESGTYGTVKVRLT